MPESVVLLHGFSGTRSAWDGVEALLERERYSPIAVDLPGHGRSSAVKGPITFERCVRHVLRAAPGSFALCGYSMGGRIALHVALAAPERVRRLILVSSTAGIEGERERAARRASDRRLAERLEEHPLEDFIVRWRSQPLFAGEPSEVARLAAADQRRNTGGPLAAALRGLGTGEMAPLWGRLAELEIPVTVLAGERDEKFQRLGRRMAELARNGRMLVARGGHNLPLENPAAVAAAIAAGD